MNRRQEQFVAEYLKDLNATGAARRAGYKNPDRIGYENLRKHEIQAAIKEALAGRIERLQIDQDYVVRRLYELVERCMTAEPVLDREGEPTGEYRFDSSGAARGLELLGKHLQMFTDKIKVEKINVDLNAYADLTDKELTMKANSRQIGKN